MMLLILYHVIKDVDLYFEKKTICLLEFIKAGFFYADVRARAGVGPVDNFRLRI